MVDPPRRSLPSSAGDVQLRRLGRSKANADSPLRGQVVVALVLVLVVLGVPLYLMRRPTLNGGPAAAGSSEHKAGVRGVSRTHLDAGAEKPRVTLGEVQRIKCSTSASKQGNSGPQCDPLPALEDMLRRTIRSQVECAPSVGAGSINFVLNVDFNSEKVNVFPGRSGEWKGPQAKRAAQCVEDAFPKVRWETISRRYRFYTLAMMAQYSAPAALDILPTFE